MNAFFLAILELAMLEGEFAFAQYASAVMAGKAGSPF